jgi:hypothetical protein
VGLNQKGALMNETELAAEVKKIFPKMERIENSVKVGTPDLLLPTPTGWRFVELKIEHGDVWKDLYFQKSQLAFMVNTRFLPKPCQVVVLVALANGSAFYTIEADKLLKFPRVAVSEKLVRVTIMDRPTPTGLREALFISSIYNRRGV